MFDQIRRFFSVSNNPEQRDGYNSIDSNPKLTGNYIANKGFDLNITKHLQNFIDTLDYSPSRNLRTYWANILMTIIEDGYFKAPKPEDGNSWFIQERLQELEKAGYIDYIGFDSYSLGPKMWQSKNS